MAHPARTSSTPSASASAPAPALSPSEQAQPAAPVPAQLEASRPSSESAPPDTRPERALRIEHLAIGSLTPWARNARTHSPKQLRQIAGSIETFGWTSPVLVDMTGTILAGHGRVEAAKLLGMTTVPAVRLEHLTLAQRRAYVLADSKLALNAGWDDQLLGEELAELMGIEDLGFDLGITGFTIAEMDELVEGLSVEEPGDPRDDEVPEIAPRRVQLGDVWRLGPHRLVCGDALDPQVVTLLMDGEQARMIFTDPPYNVPIDGHVLTKSKGASAPRHPEFLMASGEMTRAEFTAFLTRALQNMADHSIDGSIHFICMDWRHLNEILAAGEEVFDEVKNLIVWAKDNGGMGSFYRSRHELIFAFKHGTAPHVNSFELGQHGRYRTNIWQYKGVNTRRAGRMEELAIHPTCKPVQMIVDAIKDVSGRGEIVLDLFGGSGSTLIAAHKVGRRARLVEIDPLYCDRILARWEALAHDEAELVERGSALEGSSPDAQAPTPEASRRKRGRGPAASSKDDALGTPEALLADRQAVQPDEVTS